MAINPQIPLTAVPYSFAQTQEVGQRAQQARQNTRLNNQQGEINRIKIESLKQGLQNEETRKGIQQYTQNLMALRALVAEGKMDTAREFASSVVSAAQERNAPPGAVDSFASVIDGSPEQALPVIDRELSMYRPYLKDIFVDVKRDGQVVGQRNLGTGELSNVPEGVRGGPNETRELKQGDQIITQEYRDGQWQDVAEADRFSGTPQTTVNVGGGQLSPFQEAVDKAFAADYLAFQQGGGADSIKQISQLNEALKMLESGEPVTGTALNLLPPTMQAFFNTDGVIAKEAVEEVVQRNLRLILGAQFTEKEGERLIARAYNEKLPPEENAKRVRRLLAQMTTAADQKQAMAQYAEQHGTLAGFKGEQPTVGDFYEAIDAPSASSKYQIEVVE